MDYRRRSRSRSPERRHQEFRRKRSRSRSPERRYHNDKEIGRNQQINTIRSHDAQHDMNSISTSVQDQMNLLKQKASNKLAKEQLKQERLALIKNITETDNSNTTTTAPATDNDNEELDEEEDEMRKLLGFGGFNTTKGKEVADNHAGAVAAHSHRQYRQYMNRKTGFNRPLDK